MNNEQQRARADIVPFEKRARQAFKNVTNLLKFCLRVFFPFICRTLLSMEQIYSVCSTMSVQNWQAKLFLGGRGTKQIMPYSAFSDAKSNSTYTRKLKTSNSNGNYINRYYPQPRFDIDKNIFILVLRSEEFIKQSVQNRKNSLRKTRRKMSTTTFQRDQRLNWCVVIVIGHLGLVW